MPADELPETFHVTTDEQLRAVSNLTRHRIMAVLRFEPATITQIAARVGLAKGSSSYHVRLLERAGLVKVVRTRKVRGVTERYYAMAARAIVLPDPGEGGPDVLMRHAVADLEASPVDAERHVRMAHLRLTEEQFAELGRGCRRWLTSTGSCPIRRCRTRPSSSHCSTRHRASRLKGTPSDLGRTEVADRVRTAVDRADDLLAR